MNYGDLSFFLAERAKRLSETATKTDLLKFYVDYCSEAGHTKIARAIYRGSGRIAAGELSRKEAIKQLQKLPGNIGENPWTLIARALNPSTRPLQELTYARLVQRKMDRENCSKIDAIRGLAPDLKNAAGELPSSKEGIRLNELKLAKAYNKHKFKK